MLLHGWGGNVGVFAKLQERLSRRFTVYVIDLPGFGLSTQPAEIWGSGEYADLIAQFISDLNISQPIFLGHSFGGKIVINLVARGLVAAKKIILVDSSGIQLPKSLKLKIKVRMYKMLKAMSQLSMVRNFLGAKFEAYKNKCGSTDYKNASGVMRSILVKTVNENVIMLLQKINVPALVIWGEQDEVTLLQAGKIMHQAIGDSELQVIPNSGHFPFLDNWEKFIAALDIFLG